MKKALALSLALALISMQTACALRIDGDDWSSRDYDEITNGDYADTEFSWRQTGCDADAWVWGDSSAVVVVLWIYGFEAEGSGTADITWQFHLNAEFEETGSGNAYVQFQFDVYKGTTYIDSSASWTKDTDYDGYGSCTLEDLGVSTGTYWVLCSVYVVASADDNSSEAEADAYYGPLQIETSYVDIV